MTTTKIPQVTCRHCGKKHTLCRTDGFCSGACRDAATLKAKYEADRQRILDRRGLTVRDAGELVGYAFQGIHGAMSGDRNPPKKHLEAWADVLCQGKREHAKFVRLGFLEHAPEPIKRYVLKLEEENRDLRERIIDLEGK